MWCLQGKSGIKNAWWSNEAANQLLLSGVKGDKEEEEAC